MYTVVIWHDTGDVIWWGLCAALHWARGYWDVEDHGTVWLREQDHGQCSEGLTV